MGQDSKQSFSANKQSFSTNNILEKKFSQFGKTFKKIITVGPTFIIGLMCVFSGLGLITLTQTLLLYLGLTLMGLALLFLIKD